MGDLETYFSAYWVMDQIKEFEEKIPTIWLDEDLAKLKAEAEEFEKAVA